MSKFTELKKYLADEYKDGFNANIRKVQEDLYAVTFGDDTDQTNFLVLDEDEANSMVTNIIGNTLRNAKIEEFCNNFVFLGALFAHIDKSWIKKKAIELLEEEVRGETLESLGRDAYLLHLTDDADIALDNRDNPEKLKQIENEVIEAKIKEMEEDRPGFADYLLKFYEDTYPEKSPLDDAYRDRVLDLDDIVEEYVEQFCRGDLLSDNADEGKTQNYFVYEQW